MNLQQTYISLILLVVGLSDRLDINSDICDAYYEKFETFNKTKKTNGVGAYNIAFSGYFNEQFNDKYFWGLVQEDGKAPEETCLDLKLYQFPASDYQNGTQVTDLAIQPSNDTEKQWRYQSFIIKYDELAKRLIQTSNSLNNFFKGHYGIAFYLAGINQVQFTFYFEFTIIVSKQNTYSGNTFFTPLSSIATANCIPTGQCAIVPQTQINWCSNFNCTSFQTPDLHFKDQFVLQQVVTNDDMKGFYLTGTQVWYTGAGLHKRAIIQQIDNNVVGQVKVLLNAEIVWRNFTIIIISVLSNDRDSIFLTQTSSYTVTGSTNEIQCIKSKNSSTCPTCLEELNNNEYSKEDCPIECCLSKIISSILLLIYIMIF